MANTHSFEGATIKFSAKKCRTLHAVTYRGKITITDKMGRYGETLTCNRETVEDAIRDAREFYFANYTQIAA